MQTENIAPVHASTVAPVESGVNNKPNTPQLGEPLEDALIKQIEYYFSRQNLATDAFLVSQMDSEMWVSVDVIAAFKKVSTLTTDANTILRVLSRSSEVVVDSQKRMLKPNWKLPRTTIILRDVPSDAPVEEVKALFGDSTVNNVHSDVGDTWFVTFDTEDAAIDAVFQLKNKQFRGKEVKARVKSEHILKTAYTGAVAPPEAYGYYRGGYTGYVPYVQGQYPAGQYYQQSGQPRGPRRTPQNTITQGQQPQYAYKDGRKGQPGQDLSGQAQAGARADKTASKTRKLSKKGDVNVPQLNTQHFPPLGRQRSGSFKTGYSKDFKKFTRDEIVQVIKTVSDLSSSELLPTAKENGVLVSKPNTYLEVYSIPVTQTTTPEPTTVTSSTTAAAGTQTVEWPVKQNVSNEQTSSVVTSDTTNNGAADKSPNNNNNNNNKNNKNNNNIIDNHAVNNDNKPPASPAQPKAPSYAAIALGVPPAGSPTINNPPSATPTSSSATPTTTTTATTTPAATTTTSDPVTPTTLATTTPPTPGK